MRRAGGLPSGQCILRRFAIGHLSASSKTACGTAFCLHGRNDIELITLTSQRNRAFVERLGCLDQTVTYDAVTSMPNERATLYIDFSGDESLRSAVHHHFGASLRYDCFAGSAQNINFLRNTGLPGPESKF